MDERREQEEENQLEWRKIDAVKPGNWRSYLGRVLQSTGV